MGIALTTLKNRNWIDLSINGWEKVLIIAAKNGWEPMGTVPHQWCGIAPEDWNGNYFSCDFQTVCAEDTLGIAAALELAVADLEESSVEWIQEFVDLEWMKGFVDICRASGGIMIS
ncbi:MAG: hypothetical protein ACLQVJ_03360 [Syntrophobacteraceae bacterium]